MNPITQTQTRLYRGTRRRTEHVGPETELFDWFGANLPNAHHFYVTDLDMIIRDRSGNLMLVEVKRKGFKTKHHQKRTFQVLDRLIRAGIKATLGKVHVDGFPMPVTYKGLHLLEFENTNFEDGQVRWDNREIDEFKLIQILSFQYNPKSCISMD